MTQESSEQIYANRLLFNKDGSYAGFDETELTSDSGNQKVAIVDLII